MNGFSFIHRVRVRFAETDAQGIAHHASYLVWFEEARVAYLAEHAGGYKSIRARGIEALTTAAHVRYHLPAEFDDVIDVGLRCVDLRGARFRYEYRLEREGALVAVGWTSHAIVDAKTRRPMRVPAWFVDAVERAQDTRPSPLR